MAQTQDAIDISDYPELVRLVEEVRSSNAPIVLRRGGEDLAVLTPLGNGAEVPGSRTRTQEDYEAFLRSAGSWKGLVDADKLIEAIYESRGRPTRKSSEQ